MGLGKRRQSIPVRGLGTCEIRSITDGETEFSDIGYLDSSIFPEDISNVEDVVDEAGNPFTDTNYVPVGQSNPDNLNANANLQVSNVDVSNANPVPISDAGGSITVDGTVSEIGRASCRERV